MAALLVRVECPECRVSGSSHWILCNANGRRERPRVEVCFLAGVLIASHEVNHAFQLELHVAGSAKVDQFQRKLTKASELTVKEAMVVLGGNLTYDM